MGWQWCKDEHTVEVVQGWAWGNSGARMIIGWQWCDDEVDTKYCTCEERCR
jgi:hypothetical protein